MNSSFALDILLNFRTAYISHEGADVLESSKVKIAINYAKGFLLIDLLSTVPLDMVLANGAASLVQLFKATKVVKLVRILRVLKLVRILRLLKVRNVRRPASHACPPAPRLLGGPAERGARAQAPALMKHLEDKIGLMLVRIGSLIFMVIFILHIFACTFHYVAILNEHTESWIEASGIVDSSSQLDRCGIVCSGLLGCAVPNVLQRYLQSDNTHARLQICDVCVLGNVHDGHRWVRIRSPLCLLRELRAASEMIGAVLLPARAVNVCAVPAACQ